MHYDLTLVNPNTVKPAVAPLGLEYVAASAPFVDPVFYLSAEAGTADEVVDYLGKLTAAGARGAYWDILRRSRLPGAEAAGHTTAIACDKRVEKP